VSGASSRKATAFAALGTIVGTPLLAVAADDTHHAGAEDVHHAGTAASHDHAVHAPSVSELLFPAINFAIFAVIIVKYLIPALREYLRRRARDVTTAITESSAALADAEGLMSATRRRSSAVATERESIRRDVVTSATRQAERLREQAEETGKRRLVDAALVAEQERRRAVQEIRAEVATLATEIAESRLRAVLSADDQRAFVEEFLKEAPSR
jgi:F-type H+-transporting ATPase subunit b